MSKVYVIVEDWANGGDGNTSVVGVFATRSEARKALAIQAIKAQTDMTFEKVEQTEDYFNAWDTKFYSDNHDYIKIEEHEVKGEEPKIYWNEFYKTRQCEPNLDGDEEMTVANALKLGYNMLTVYDPETQINYEAGYLETDGTFALYDLNQERVDNWVVSFAEKYDDEDDYPCLATTLIDKGGIK